MGGECTLFSEMVTRSNFWEKMLPRLFLFSDIFWGQVKPQYPDWLEYSQSLIKIKDMLEGQGYYVEKISSRYCERNTVACFSYIAPQMETEIVSE
jgi:hypothetical protein